MEHRIYDLLGRCLPGATVLSITNRPSLAQYHQRQWELKLGDRGGATPQSA